MCEDWMDYAYERALEYVRLKELATMEYDRDCYGVEWIVVARNDAINMMLGELRQVELALSMAVREIGCP